MVRIIFIAVFLSSIVFNQNYYRGDSLIQKGVYAFYNYEFDEAVTILDKARKEFPEHPGVHLIWVASLWVQSQAYNSTEETYSTLESGLTKIYPIYKELVLKYEYDPNYRLYQGSAVGLTARVTLGRKQWLKTLFWSYKGFSIIDDVANNYPNIYDAQLPIGIVEYYAGISNIILKWAVKIYGLEASKRSGLEKILIAADKGQWSWIEAKSILCNLYLWVENDPLLSLEHSKDLVEQFPKNYYFNLLYFESMIRNKNIAQSLLVLENMEDILNNLTIRQKEWYSSYQYYAKALFSFYQEDYLKVLESIDPAINNYSGELDIVLGNSYLLQGMANDKLYRRDEARNSYNHCIALDNFSSSIKLAKKYLNQPYSGN